MPLAAAEHHGQVKFGGLPVPGVVVTASQGETKVTVITDTQGLYVFPDLPAGTWSIAVQMSGFSETQQDIAVAADTAGIEWELTMLPLEAIHTEAQTAAMPATPNPTSSDPDPEELSQRAAEAFLINGTANNGDASPFGQSPAFGNNRNGRRSLYNGNLGVMLGNSVLDARPFSLTGQNTPRPDYNRLNGILSFGGPLKIPHLLRRNGPNLILNYQWVRNRNVTTQSGLMPTEAQRSGAVSPQAKALLVFYPLPNFAGSSRYNYQIPIIGNTHQDNLLSRWNQSLPRRNQLRGELAYFSSRTDSPNLFGFLDKTHNAGVNTSFNWLHVFNPRVYTSLGYQFSRSAARVTPFFANRVNVSGEAGIAGNNQEPANWGPPALSFAGGISGLSDVQSSFRRNQTGGASLDIGWSRGRHNLTFGGLYRRQQFNLLSQEDPRGSFTFTGASGADFASFLQGIPDTSSIAFGNADKYFRASSSAIYATDDWRFNAGLTLNLGIRWEYESPITERYGRLVNLDIAAGFRAVAPVVGSPLMRPDRNNFAPRVGFAWRPFPASSMVVRGGYGVYYDAGVYPLIAPQMAQQSPLSTSLRAENSAATPLKLANAFMASSAVTRNTFAIDPGFRIGYAQNWQMSIQRDLPASLVMIATYSGSKGTRAQQQFLPNTVPLGVPNPCASCPAGFVFQTSNGNSIRHAAQIEMRRRLRSGFTTTVRYTFSKSIDNAALGGRNQGGALIAQNWLDLRAERALSNFDQRHLLSIQSQYTSGMGLRGGTLLGGWRGGLFKDWTVSSDVTAGSGLPLTPIYFAAVRGTGITGSIRPDYTGAPLYDAPAGFFLNPAAYAAPAPGHWGNAGRNSIFGPSQFTLNASLSRTFRVNDRLSLDFRLDAANALNHPVFPSWNTVVTSAQFGLRNPANPMRSVQTLARLRF